MTKVLFQNPYWQRVVVLRWPGESRCKTLKSGKRNKKAARSVKWCYRPAGLGSSPEERS